MPTLRRRLVVALTAAAMTLASIAPAMAHHGPPYIEGPDHTFGEMVDYPLVFPVQGQYAFTGDTFDAWRCCDPGEIHHAQDLMADKGTPIVAAADATVSWIGGNCCSVFLRHDDGWETWYIHLNNDTPGTDDGLGWGIGPGIERGTRVEAGQVIGWVGDSGNAENTPPHLHFELIDPNDTIVNPYEALRAAELRAATTCDGYPATLLDDDFDGVIEGTDDIDVIVGGPGPDRIDGLGGDDIICGGGGDDIIDGGSGHDRIWADGGDDTVHGGPGNDAIDGGDGDDQLSGDDGDDTVHGGPGNDQIDGGDGDDSAAGDAGNDRLFGQRGHDDLAGGVGMDLLVGGPGSDLLDPGTGRDRVRGGGGRDTILAAAGRNRIVGGAGDDLIDYLRAQSAIVDLLAGTGSGPGTDSISSVERVRGSRGDDTLRGDDGANVLVGRGGDDVLEGRAGDDRLVGGVGDDTGLGGEGNDVCAVETPTDC